MTAEGLRLDKPLIKVPQGLPPNIISEHPESWVLKSTL